MLLISHVGYLNRKAQSRQQSRGLSCASSEHEHLRRGGPACPVLGRGTGRRAQAGR